MSDVLASLREAVEAARRRRTLAERDAALAEVIRLREALEQLDGECAYEIEERRCCSEGYPQPYDEWCVRCFAHGALAEGSDVLPTQREH